MPSDWHEARNLSLGLAMRLVRQPQDAEDIAQEALIRAWRNRDRLRDEEAFRPWLARIVSREASRRLAAPQPVLVAELTENAAVDAESLGVVELRLDVSRAVAALDERERLLIRLRYDEDLTQPAIARKLGMPEGTVKVLLHRARGKLRRALDEA